MVKMNVGVAIIEFSLRSLSYNFFALCYSSYLRFSVKSHMAIYSRNMFGGMGCAATQKGAE